VTVGAAAGLREALLELIPEGSRVSTGDSVLDLHAADYSLHHPHRPDVVVFPNATAEVSRVLALATEWRVPVVAFGAGTSLEGHVIPIAGGISLDMTRLDRILELSPADLTATVQAGVTRNQLNRAAGEHGLFFPVDPGADATLGGMAATNAAGTTTVRYGKMRAQVLALEVVLADGRVVRTGTRAPKTSAGYDLLSLFVGSEGTLGVITELTLRLRGIPEETVAARATFPDVEAACRAAAAIVAAGASVSRVELVDDVTVRFVNAFKGTSYPERPTLFLETSGGTAAVDADLDLLRELARDEGCESFELERDPTGRARLWDARHEAAYAVIATAPGKKPKATDVCVPLSELPAAIRAARAVVERLGLDAAIHGHVGDGNYHVALMVDPNDPIELRLVAELDETLVDDALARGGTCTGEHGIGLGKQRSLAKEHGDLLPLLHGVKALFDPHGILNPGKVLPPD
jgi:D-lactate dehydrogenase (cytochrome)